MYPQSNLTHLLILAKVVSATNTKSSAGESWTPFGNLSPTIKTFTSFVTVSYSSRLKTEHYMCT